MTYAAVSSTVDARAGADSRSGAFDHLCCGCEGKCDFIEPCSFKLM
jgi:hypothetical protein